MSAKLSLNSGSVFDNFSVDYDLKDKIGEGAFSDVWSCVQRSNGQLAAAKVLKNDYKNTMTDATWNSISEINVANSLKNHPFLLTLKKAYYDDKLGRVTLVTELMKKSLFDIIEEKKCPLPEFQIKSYMYQMLEGLKYLHENGFIHRDIKPENILLKSNEKLLKIGDFGAACQVTDGKPYAYYVATRWYRSPECLLTAGWYGTKMDIWATGCVLYEISTGQPLFDGQDENDQIDKIDRVLGSPEYRLIEKFKKHKSDVFVKRYEGTNQNEKITPGAGLHTVYQPYRTAYELLKDMIVYDPLKRFSADRLLRKPYFEAMKNTQYEYKIREFEYTLKKEPLVNLSSGEEKLGSMENKQLTIQKKQGPGGDREQYLQTQTEEDRKQDQEKKPKQLKKNEQEPDNIQTKNQRNSFKTCLKENMKNNHSTKNQLTASQSIVSNDFLKKNISRNLIKRPPFK